MEQEYINNGELKDFVSDNNLMDMYSNIHFKALVSIKTAQKEIKSKEMEVRITFDNFNSYGKVSLIADYIDPLLFPTIFEAGWQKMEYRENMYLHITDTHKKNPKIGMYDVKIIPLPK